MFETVLVANRGEIARRIIASCRRLGLGAVAVFADPDAGAPHVGEADTAVRLPGRTAAETYLDGAALIAAARAAGAGAVHPGYGFLSEDADFARAVVEAGLVWIGPPPAAIAAMGNKVAAKRLLAEAGVPVLAELEPDRLTEADLPVLIKAAAGGGGRGMRLVSSLAELPGQLAAARTEAERAFGSGEVFCERYVPAGHHVEVQLLADAAGTVWVLGERECSVQRRHQKVIEESPSPLAERVPALRERLFAATEAAARAIGYVGAGTVEFICDADGNCWFLEVNTRLQVEHPVTECVTGLDLVELQLRIAGGEQLAGTPPPPAGHAIEARLYAEDPANGWQPQTGLLHELEFPDVSCTFSVSGSSGLRLDSGVAAGTEVHPHADPMLAKLISYGPDRESVRRRLASALRRGAVHGPLTNRDQLVRVLQSAQFRDGVADTTLLDDPELGRPLLTGPGERLAAAAAALAAAVAERAAAPVLASLPGGWRNLPTEPQRRCLAGPGGEHPVAYWWSRDGFELPELDASVVTATATEVVLRVAGVQHRLRVRWHGDSCWVDSDLGSARFGTVERFADPAAAVPAGSLLAPLPGAVLRLAVEPGETVRRGQPLLWIEAMKMEHPVPAPHDGVVAELPVRVGSQLAVGDLLAVIVR